MSREKTSYRAERRNYSRKEGLIWGRFPRVRTTYGNIFVVTDPDAKVRKRLNVIPVHYYPYALKTTFRSKQHRKRGYIKPNYAGRTEAIRQANDVYDRCVERLGLRASTYTTPST